MTNNDDLILDSDLILRIEGLTQQIEDKREWLRSMFPDASAYMGDSSTMESLVVSPEDRDLTKTAIGWMKEFIADGIYKAKTAKAIDKPKHEKKTVNIQDIIKGKT